MDDCLPIFTEDRECQDCYKCVRECKLKAIKVENNKATVLPEKCVFCGTCFETCPVQAKKVRNDTEKLDLLLNQKKKVIASIAPSWITEFPGISKNTLIRALKKIGFWGVSETAIAAEYLNQKIKLLLHKEKRLLISSACPSVVLFIEQYYPEFLPYLLKYESPMIIHGKLLKKYFGNNTEVVFIGPCIAKKTESDKNNDIINAALGFNDLKEVFKDRGIDLIEENLAQDEENNFIPYNAKAGALYPIDGGMIRSFPELSDYEFLSYSGVNTIKELFKHLREIPNKGIFLELLSCENGCINGPLVTEKKNSLVTSLKLISENKEKINHSIDQKVNIERSFSNRKKEAPLVPQEKIEEKLRLVGKVKPSDELNCGGCGYDNCRDFALAMIGGKAESVMCVSYMRKLAQKKANALIKSIPSGVVIFNNDLAIIESNENFSKLLGGDYEMIQSTIGSLEGLSLKKLKPFRRLFDKIVNNGEGQISREVTYENKVLFTSVFSIEESRIAGAILQDVTNPFVQRQQIVKKAEEVIENNNKTVQKIAYLLGENAAESEMILSSIIGSFRNEKPKQ